MKIPPGLSAKLSAFFEIGSGKEIRYRTIGLDGSFMYVIYNTRLLYIQLKGGVTIMNDALLTPIEEGTDENSYNRMKYGVLGGGELDYMLDRKKIYSFVAGWDQRFLFNKGDSWGNERWYAYVGLRWKVGNKHLKQ